jgi:hypothetical protein
VSEKSVSVSQHLSNDERITFLDEVKEEKKMLKGEVTEEMAIEREKKEEKGGRGDMMDVEDAFDVLVRAATTNPTTNGSNTSYFITLYSGYLHANHISPCILSSIRRDDCWFQTIEKTIIDLHR